MKKKFKFWQVIKLFSEDRIESAYRKRGSFKIYLKGSESGLYSFQDETGQEIPTQQLANSDLSSTWYVQYKNQRQYSTIILTYVKNDQSIIAGKVITISKNVGISADLENWARLTLSENNSILSVVGIEKTTGLPYILDEQFLVDLAELDEGEE